MKFSIFYFLIETCGLTQSPKTQCRIPSLIRTSSVTHKAAFLRGLADTDFSLVFKKNGRYPVIDFCTCSKALLEDVVEMLLSLGFKGHSGIYRTNRKGTPITRHYLQLNGRMNLEKWMTVIGFTSPIQLFKYGEWIKSGYSSKKNKNPAGLSRPDLRPQPDSNWRP